MKQLLSLKNKLLLLSFVALNLLTCAALLSAMQVFGKYEFNEASNDTKVAAEIFGEQVINVIKSVDATLQTASYLINLDPAPARLKELVEDGAINMDPLVQIAYVDSIGRIIGTNSGPDLNLTSVVDREHIRVHFDSAVKELFIGRPVVGRVSGKWAIQLTRAIRSSDRAVRGIVVASMDPYYFSQLWNSLNRANPDIELSLVGRDNIVLTSNRLSEGGHQIGREFIASHTLFRHQKTPETITTALFDKLRSSTQNGENSLFVIAQMTPSVFAKRISKIENIVISFGLIIFFILNLLIYFFSASLRKAQLHEANARIAQERLQQAVESLPDCFVLFDQEDRLVVCNEAYKALIPANRSFITPGSSFGEIIERIRGSGADRYWSPEFTRWIEERLQRKTFAFEPFECQFPMGHWMRIYDRRTSDGCVVGIRINITDLKVREFKLIAIQDMLAKQVIALRNLANVAELATNAKSSFVAAVSHELRTPLNAILGFANLLKESPLQDEQREFVSILKGSAEYLAQIVNDILDFTRIEAKRLEISPVLFQLHDLLQSIEELSRPLIGTRPIVIKFQIAPDVPKAFVGDARRIKQILLNLLSNAVKFTDSGVVDVHISLVSKQQDICELSLAVTDSARGISPEMLSKLFVPFEQGQVSDNLRASGTGLGLAISRGLAELMNGQLTVASEIGVGSTFNLQIPLGIREIHQIDLGVAQFKASARLQNFRALQILVADDAESSRMLCGIILSRRGHHPTLVENGGNAIKAARETKFDLILMDKEMPGTDGAKAVEIIRRGPSASSGAYIVALTAQAFDEQRAVMLSAGCNEVLLKPFNFEDIDMLLSKLSKADYPQRSYSS